MLTNCTFSGNTAANDGGLEIRLNPSGGSTTATLTNCTVSGNIGTSIQSGVVGGVYVSGNPAFINTIVAGNTNHYGAGDIGGPGTVSGSNNLIGTGGSGGLVNGVDGNLVGVANPGLGPLGNHGGPTQTMALLLGSPALGAGTAVGGITTDQQGQPVDFPSPDIGAYQYNPRPFIVATAGGQLQGWLGGRPDTTFRIDVFASSAYNADGSGEEQDFLGSLMVTTDAAGLVSFAIPFAAPAGLPDLTATASDSQGETGDVSALRSAVLQFPTKEVRNVPGQPVIFSSAGGDAIALQDPDAGPLDPVWSLTLSVGAGTLTLSSTAGLTGSGDGTGSLSYSGPLSAINAALEGLALTPLPGSSGGMTLSLDAESVGAWSTQAQVVIVYGLDVVTTTADSGPGSLRQAILDANAFIGPANTIDFAIPGSGVQTIAPLSPLPAISSQVLIDGESQPGYNGTPLIAIIGSQACGGDGLTITGSDVTVRGLDITNFSQGAGIHLTGTGATGDWIYGDFLGTDPTGTKAMPNNVGVEIDGGASNDLIGTNGDGVNDAAERNLISGNAFAGIRINGQGTDDNAVAGNLIGTSVTGDAALGNGTSPVYYQYVHFGGGVVIQGGASYNRIGTDGNSVDDVGERNIISGSGNDGIDIIGTGTDENVVAGNFIGTDPTGTRALGNNTGVALYHGASFNWIGVNPKGGTALADEGNVISGNFFVGVNIVGPILKTEPGTNANVIAGNKIGTDITGTQALGNTPGGVGIEDGASGNTIGGVTAAAGNLITNNDGPGVTVGTSPTDLSIGNQITANRIFGNTGPAIDLGSGVGVIDNGPSPRVGPNNFQNFPVFVQTADGQIEGSLAGSLPDTTFRIDFFASAAYGPGGSGEAQVYLGSLSVTTDASGQVSFAVPFTAPAGLPILTATATDPQGNTSELSTFRQGSLQVPSGSLHAVPNQSLAIATQSGGGIAIEDPNAAANPVWDLTLAVSDGTLTLPSTAGLTGSGDGTGSLSYSGPLAALNAALEGLIFNPPAGAQVLATVAVAAQSYGAQSLQAQFAITDGVYVVDTTADSGPGSLRQAILDADSTTGPTVTIDFAIPGAGVQTIAPLTPLPAIAASVLIDGTTQPGFAGTPLIAVSAAPAGGPAALTIAGSDVTVRGLAVDQFAFVTTTNLVLVAQVHPQGLTTELSLLDSQGQVLVQSDGVSSSDPDDLAAEQLVSGSYFLKVASTGGAGTYTLTTTVAQTTAAFQPVPVGNGPDAIVAGDFTGDGRTDLAVANKSDNTVSVLLSNGDGTFQPQVTYAVGTYPDAIVAGDFTGDGHLDLAVANYGSNDVSVLLGNGDGTFQPQVTYAAGFGPGPIVAGDFNGDGHLDLAVGNLNYYRGSTVSVLLGNGDGTFQPEVTYAVGTSPNAMVAGDFTGDGHLDLAVVISTDTGEVPGAVSVLLGNGDGTFVAAGQFVTTPYATPLVADVTGDGTDDVLVVDGSGNILYRQAIPGQPGSFLPPVTINPGNPSRDIAWLPKTSQGPVLASVDAHDDAISFYAYRDGHFVRLDGSLATGQLPAQIIAAQLDGNGLDDLVVRNAGDGTVSVYLGSWFNSGFVGPSGTLAAPIFTAAFIFPVGLGVTDVQVADTTGSGVLDLVVTNKLTGQVSILRNLGGGLFAPPVAYRAGTGLLAIDPGSTPEVTSLDATVGVTAGSFTTGGPPDLVTINPGSDSLDVLAGLGGGRFANPVAILTPGPAQVVRVADFTGNGIPDLAVLTSTGVSIYLGNGKGGFFPPVTYDAGVDPTGLTVADLLGNGKLDLLVGNAYGDVLILVGNGDGPFRPFEPVKSAIALAVADLTGNGALDFVFADQSLNQVSVVYGTTGQDANSPAVIGNQTTGVLAPGAVLLADLNGDGIPDLIVANSGGNNVLVYPGLGNGQFGPPVNGTAGFPVGTDPTGLAVADLNGQPDLLVADTGSNDVSVLLGQGSGSSWTMIPGARIQTDAGPVALAVGNLLGANQTDLAVANSGANNVQVFPSVGSGFFNDQPQATKTYAVGQAPSSLFLGNFNGLGQGLATLNAGSDDGTMISNLDAASPVTQTFATGGDSPTSGFAGDFTGNGLTDLVVGNNGDGHLALLLGGSGGLSLSQTLVSAEAPNPTSLSFAGVSDGQLSFYVSTAGREAAMDLAFNLDGGGVSEPGSSPVSATSTGESSPSAVLTQATTGSVQQVSQLLSLSGTTLDLAATLLTVSVVSTEFESGSGGGAVGTIGFGQPRGTSGQASSADDPAAEPGTDPAAVNDRLPALERLSIGLGRAWEQARTAILELESGSPGSDGPNASALPARPSQAAPRVLNPAPARPGPRTESTPPNKPISPASVPDQRDATRVAVIDAALEDLDVQQPSRPPGAERGWRLSQVLNGTTRTGRVRALVALAVSAAAAGAVGMPVARWVRRRSSTTSRHPINLVREAHI
jgi:hypothetical protein